MLNAAIPMLIGLLAAGSTAQDEPARAPLMPEGSILTAQRATVSEDPDTGWLVATLADRAEIARTTLVLLPGPKLAEVRSSLATGARRFELSGRLTTYRGRNFILATSAPALTNVVVPAEDPAATEDPETSGDTVADIVRELSNAVGPLRARPAPEPDVANAPTAEPWLDRRGRMRRAASGAWLFVPDVDDGTGPLVVMPCATLERLERTILRSGWATAVILSGEVHSYRGQRYLLPNRHRVADERTPLRRLGS